MKINNKPETEKRMDLLISKISVNDILDISEMICTRGGDGNVILPPPPPPDPPKTDSITKLLDLSKL